MHEAITNLEIGPYSVLGGLFKAKVTFEDYDENDDKHYDLVIVLNVKTPFTGWGEYRQRFTTTGDLIPEGQAH